MLTLQSCKYSPVWPATWLILLVTVAVLSFNAKKAHAATSTTFETELERHDVPLSQIKKGTVLATVYVKSQTLYINTLLPEIAGEVSLFHLLINYSGDSIPGCPVSGDFLKYSLGILRYTPSGRESTCASISNLLFLNNIKFNYTGETEGRYYVQSAVIPKTKLFDIVVNNPQLFIKNGAGKTLTLSRDNIFLHIIPYTGMLKMSEPSITIPVGATKPAVFFPLQNSSSALLQLPVRPSSGSDNSLATGSASVDLCLYDGAGLSSSRYMLSFQDPNTANTTPDFRVYDQSGRLKIDYAVTLTDPSGTPRPVINNTPFFWDNMKDGGAAQSRIKYVQLPDGISGLVPCVPATVTAAVKPVRYSSLRAGNYTGKINILFTPSTN